MSGHRILVVAAAVVVALSGCSAAVPPSDQTPSWSGEVADGGILLADLGIEHGPTGFSVPEGLTIIDIIDQPNVVTITMDAEANAILNEYLVHNLDGMGFSIQGDADNALVFTAPGWEGGYVSEGDLTAMTLRPNPGSFQSYAPR